MSNRFVLIIISIAIFLVFPTSSFAQSWTDPDFAPISNAPKAPEKERQRREEKKVTEEAIGEKAAERAGEEEGKTPAQVEDECTKGTQACNVDRKVREIEEIVQQTREKQESQNFWDMPDMEEKPTGGKKVAFYIVSVPTTYVARFVTWPLAFLGDYLIKKGIVEKVIDAVSNKERTFWVYPRLEMGFGNGFGGGVGVRHYDLMDQNYQFFANYIVYLNVDQRGAFGVSKPDLFHIAGRPFGFRFETKLMHDKDTPFYGIGIGAPNNKTNYAIDAIMTGFAATYEPVDKLMLEGGFYFLADTTMPGESPSAETVFPLDELPGFNREISYAGFGLSIIHDNRDAAGRPEKGGLQRGTFARFHGLGVNGFDFNWYKIEVQQYFKLPFPRHSIGLRTMWQYRQPTGDGGEVPFYYLSTIDVYSPVRGFSSGRFRDRGSYVFNVVYRFPVWEYLDGEFFFDTGRVFHTMSDISFKHLKYASGGGLLFSTKNYFLARMELGYGGEGVKFLFKTSQAF